MNDPNCELGLETNNCTQNLIAENVKGILQFIRDVLMAQ